jgi:hypothetical protein
MEKVDRSGECWLWTAAVFDNGYGAFRDGPRQRRAHRWAYEHFVGPIPEAAILMHSCDVRRCVNPQHLTPGSDLDNQRDMMAKGRVGMRGLHMKTRSTLTEELAEQLRHDYATTGKTQRELAEEYGVSQATVSLTILGKRWA